MEQKRFGKELSDKFILALSLCIAIAIVSSCRSHERYSPQNDMNSLLNGEFILPPPGIEDNESFAKTQIESQRAISRLADSLGVELLDELMSHFDDSQVVNIRLPLTGTLTGQEITTKGHVALYYYTKLTECFHVYHQELFYGKDKIIRRISEWHRENRNKLHFNNSRGAFEEK